VVAFMSLQSGPQQSAASDKDRKEAEQAHSAIDRFIKSQPEGKAGQPKAGPGGSVSANGQVKLGADASAAAGPKGRNAGAATDIVMRAEILTYSRARGLFAGVSLEGSTLRSDGGANRNLYGRELDARQIVREKAVAVPKAGQPLVDLLNRRSPKNISDKADG